MLDRGGVEVGPPEIPGRHQPSPLWKNIEASLYKGFAPRAADASRYSRQGRFQLMNVRGQKEAHGLVQLAI